MSKKTIIIIVVICVICVIIVRADRKMKYPVNGKHTSGFGNRKHPITGVNKFHNGLDIAVPTGTAVISPADGTVTSRYFNSIGGNQLVIKHNNGFQTGYAHLSKFLVQVGDKVTKGQNIAQTGNTGASTGPHLHLTLRKNGVLVNPEDYFS